ncbi:winged helix-turn-helix domain-containing protein [Halobaculum sp. EA56]|uniref:winged helix-turn-helix domain-containing protein n=1 Tax=Halobaculum sp. EA56 TaxID=3421648 RepID=UPI003EBA32CC
MKPRLPDWMTPVDRDILELLKNEGGRELVMNPRHIAENTDWSRPTVREHVRTLFENGMLEYYDESGSIYQLTEQANAFLEGQIAADELEDEEE